MLSLSLVQGKRLRLDAILNGLHSVTIETILLLLLVLCGTLLCLALLPLVLLVIARVIWVLLLSLWLSLGYLFGASSSLQEIVGSTLLVIVELS